MKSEPHPSQKQVLTSNEVPAFNRELGITKMKKEGLRWYRKETEKQKEEIKDRKEREKYQNKGKEGKGERKKEEKMREEKRGLHLTLKAEPSKNTDSWAKLLIAVIVISTH